MKFTDLKPAKIAGPRLKSQNLIVLKSISIALSKKGTVPDNAEKWKDLISDDRLKDILQNDVNNYYNKISIEKHRYVKEMHKKVHENDQEFGLRKSRLIEDSQNEIRSSVKKEAVIAGVLMQLLSETRITELNSIFFSHLDATAKSEAAIKYEFSKPAVDFTDPYLIFDPKKDVKNVCISPIGIVHLYRQYFFELDTFLGTPISHVWLSPGSEVELIEISTRKTITEKTVEQAFETISKSEKSTTEEDELSEAVNPTFAIRAKKRLFLDICRLGTIDFTEVDFKNSL